MVIDIRVSKPTVFSVPERIRTSDLPLRRRSLYPAELREHETPKGNVKLFLRRTLMLVFGSVKIVCENGRNALKYVG